jgi:hypothetical protein
MMSSPRFHGIAAWHGIGRVAEDSSYYGGYYYTYGYHGTEPQEPPEGNEV